MTQPLNITARTSRQSNFELLRLVSQFFIVFYHVLCFYVLPVHGSSWMKSLEMPLHIGRHFPDSDPQYKGIFSIELLKATRRILMENGFVIQNVDATLIAQRPKLAAHIPQMRQNIANALGIVPEAVSVKATTTEGMGFEGAGDGISAHAVALLCQR